MYLLYNILLSIQNYFFLYNEEDDLYNADFVGDV